MVRAITWDFVQNHLAGTDRQPERRVVRGAAQSQRAGTGLGKGTARGQHQSQAAAWQVNGPGSSDGARRGGGRRAGIRKRAARQSQGARVADGAGAGVGDGADAQCAAVEDGATRVGVGAGERQFAPAGGGTEGQYAANAGQRGGEGDGLAVDVNVVGLAGGRAEATRVIVRAVRGDALELPAAEKYGPRRSRTAQRPAGSGRVGGSHLQSAAVNRRRAAIGIRAGEDRRAGTDLAQRSARARDGG